MISMLCSHVKIISSDSKLKLLSDNKQFFALQNLLSEGLVSVFQANGKTFTLTLILKVERLKFGYFFLLICYTFPML